MDRRDFLHLGAGALAAVPFGGLAALAAGPAGSSIAAVSVAGMASPVAGMAATAGNAAVSAAGVATPAAGGPLALRFLGTGEADWNGRDARGVTVMEASAGRIVASPTPMSDA